MCRLSVPWCTGKLSLALAFSFSALAATAPLVIDHVTIAGSDLGAMRAAFTAATGIATEYGGRHANNATEMALVAFPDGSYLEFMGIQAGGDKQAIASHVWNRFLRSNTGPCAFAIRVPDVNAEMAELRRAGIDVSAAARSGRTRPDGVRLEWESSNIGRGIRGTFFPFLIHDLTPRANRVYPAGKPTTARVSGISKIVIAVDDFGGAIAEYRRAFALSAPRREHDNRSNADFAWFEGTPVVLAQGTGGNSWVTKRVRTHGVGPCAVVLIATEPVVGGDPNKWFESRWFDRTVFWIAEPLPGWHLGLETAN